MTMTKNWRIKATVLLCIATIQLAACGPDIPDLGEPSGQELDAANISVSGGEADYSCRIDSWTHVINADWLKVRTSPSTSAAAVGQIPRGAVFHFCSSSGRYSGGIYWVYGYGYNGTVKLTGWVAGKYLVWP